MTTMGLEYNKYLESKRSNLARETETNRSNLANEAETHRSNVARELETNRSNLVNEAIRQGTLDETVRSNLETERISRGRLAEDVRHNKRSEDLQLSDQQLRREHNLAVEVETNRANVAREAETNRANVAMERLKSIQSLPAGADTVAALSTFVQDYGGDISQSTKKTINKYLNTALLVGAGTAAWQQNVDKAQNLILSVLSKRK